MIGGCDLLTIGKERATKSGTTDIGKERALAYERQVLVEEASIYYKFVI